MPPDKPMTDLVERIAAIIDVDAFIEEPTRTARSFMSKNSSAFNAQYELNRHNLARRHIARSKALAILDVIASNGMVIVPRQPTDTMCRAAGDSALLNRAIYAAMIEAAEDITDSLEKEK